MMDNLDSCLPVSKPYFLSIEGYSGKKSGAASVEPAGFFPQYQHSVDKKITQQEINFKSEIVSSALSPILAFKSDHQWIDEESIIPVSGKKCSCKSVWCPVCFRSRFHDRIVEIFSPYDWQATRHVILTVDPDLYKSPSAAFNEIRGKRKVGEFIRRLRKGVKEKAGSRWLRKYKHIDVLRWAWFLEWHENGFPHYHVFIQTPLKGSAGMIGGDFLRDCWKIGRVKETYFRDEAHFREMTGYYANKGYFEKGKEYQGRLPEDILNNVKGKIKRMNSSEKGYREKRELTEEEIEEKNFKECMAFFDEKQGWSISDEEKNEFVTELEDRIDEADDANEKREVNYRAMIANCGAKTYVELDIAEYRIAAICELPWKKWKEKAGISYDNNRGYISKLTKDEILELLASVVRVVSVKKYQDIHNAVHERIRQINNAEAWANLVYMRN